MKTFYRAMRLRLYLNHGCGIETTILHEKHEHQGCGQTEPVACRRKWGILRIAKAYANRTDDEWMTSLLRCHPWQNAASGRFQARCRSV